jgi:hypothetical protein
MYISAHCEADTGTDMKFASFPNKIGKEERNYKIILIYY